MTLIKQMDATDLPGSLAGYTGQADYDGIDMEDVYDLTPRKVETWMEVASDKTKAGMRIFAEHGPVVKAEQLTKSGIENLPHFQSRTTIRTRTVTRDRQAFLLGWDDWGTAEDGKGRYAVTPMTFQSLRRYFKLD